MPMTRSLKGSAGFTLAELLISLAILGVIATFTIPKVLSSSNDSQMTAIAKEAASMVSGAHSSFQLTSAIAATTTAGQMTQFMNYVAADVSAEDYTFSQACSAAPCLKLHNGGILQYIAANKFNGTAATNAIYFNLDPDGTGSNTPVTFVLYANGRLTTYGNGDATTATSGGPTAYGTLGTASTDPSYIQDWGG